MIECTPADKVEVEKVATPPLSVPVPSVVAPSRKVTVPVAPDGVIVAVNVTLCPTGAGFVLDARPVVVVTLLTVCERAVDVLPL